MLDIFGRKCKREGSGSVEDENTEGGEGWQECIVWTLGEDL
jgi:hypothetical protein